MGRNKLRRGAVPNPLQTKLKKDPGVPRHLPALKTRNVDKRPSLARSNDSTTKSDAGVDVQVFMSSSSTHVHTPQHYLRILHRIIDTSDILLLVLDARDPEGCRSRVLEEAVRRRDKRLVFVLNKIDLVPRSNAEQWLKYLRQWTPTLPFRSAPSSVSSTPSSKTAASLLKLLKTYRSGAKQSVAVGVIGYPNVGKSSLINALKRSKVCAVGARPGHTKDLQEVQLEKGIKIIDCPGVVFEDDYAFGNNHRRGGVLLRNVVKVEDISDLVAVVEEIVARTDRETLRTIYKLPEFGTAAEFLTMVALNSGRLLKGGIPDILSASRQILTDWNHQKIPYFSVPPPPNERVGEARIVDELGKPFELEGLFAAADVGVFENVAAEDDEMAQDSEVMDEGSQIMGVEHSDPHVVGSPSNPLKRSRSISSMQCLPSLSAESDSDSAKGAPIRQPKRLRRSRPEEVSSTHEDMAGRNATSRTALKKEARRARRVNRIREDGDGKNDGMEIDDGLEETLMAAQIA